METKNDGTKNGGTENGGTESPYETLVAALCDPEGNVCIDGSDEDRRLIQNALAELKDATVWIPRDERLPRLEDLVEDGVMKYGFTVNVRFVDGTFGCMHWQEVGIWKLVSHWSPIKRKEAT